MRKLTSTELQHVYGGGTDNGNGNCGNNQGNQYGKNKCGSQKTKSKSCSTAPTPPCCGAS